jgi:hypothetical protein
VTWHHYAAVPADDGASLVVVDGRLPQIGGEEYRLPAVLDAFEPLIRRPTLLRIAAQVEVGEDTLRLYEFDTTPAGARVAFADADAERLAPLELRPALEQWLAEQRGAPIPAQRPAWSRRGWHARAEGWAGEPLGQHRIWPLSAVLAGDGVFVKGVFSLFHHEPAVTQALAREHPNAVPDVLRIDEREGRLLMGELHGTPGYEHDAAQTALAALDSIHRAWRGRAAELRALGAPDRSLAVLERAVAQLVADIAPEHAPHVAVLESRCRELASRGEPETLVHGDFHSGNVMVGDDGRAVIFDWSDACIANPSVDRYLYEPESEDAVAGAVACLHHAASYRAIVASLEPSDRWWFAGAPREWLGRAVSLVV